MTHLTERFTQAVDYARQAHSRQRWAATPFNPRQAKVLSQPF